MDKLILKKDDIESANINKIIAEYCKQFNIEQDKILNIQLVCEEFLSNILFPHYSGEVDFNISKNDTQNILTFNYNGADYLNKIDNSTFLSLKLIKNKTKKVQSSTEDHKTKVEFYL